MVAIQIVGLYDGTVTEFDGQYVVDYDPKPRMGPDGPWIYLTATDDPAKARQFESAADALEFWRASYGLRPDGKPNRPLTAYTIEVTPFEPGMAAGQS